MNFKKFQFAGTPNSSVLAEKGEIYKSPNGQIQQIAQHAPSHDDGEQVNQFGIKSTSKGNGGVVVDADSVLSDSLTQVQSGSRKNSMKEQIVKIKAEEGEIIASQLGLDIRLKKSVSPSKLFLEIQEAKDKIALKIMKASEKTQKTRESSNALQANQAQLMSLPTDEEIYEAIFHTQEEKKESSGIDFEATEDAQYGKSTKVYTNKDEYLKASKSYQDSLTLHNIFVDANQKYGALSPNANENIGKLNKPITNKTAYEEKAKAAYMDKENGNKFNEYQNASLPDDYLVNPNTTNPSIKPSGRIRQGVPFWTEGTAMDLTGSNLIVDGYKKPKQIPIYEKPQTPSQQPDELNQDYLNRLHRENVYGIKQKPKLIRNQFGGAHYNKNLNYILPNSVLNEKNEDVEEPVFKLKKKEIKGDKRNGYSAYEQNGEIYMDNINDEPIKQHETFHYLRSKGYFSPREQAIENELLDGSIYSPLDKNKLNSDIYSPEELAARFHSISGYLPNNYKEEDFKKLWETGKDLQIQDLKQVIPYDKALYYMNNYHPSKMQMGGMVSKDSSNLKEIKKQRDWLRAWYGERDIVTEPIEIFENELKSVNGSKTKDPEILKQNEEFRERGKKTNFDVSAYYHTPSDRSVFLKDVTGTTDPIHEFTHSIDNNYGDNIGTFNSINPFHPLKTDYTKLGVKPIKENDYFTNTEETYARLNEARYSSGYAANYKPTLEDIKEQRRLNKKNKPKAYNHLFDYYDDNSIMQMWNGLSDTRFEESSVENPMLQQTAKYGIKKQFGGGSSILKQLQLL